MVPRKPVGQVCVWTGSVAVPRASGADCACAKGEYMEAVKSAIGKQEQTNTMVLIVSDEGLYSETYREARGLNHESRLNPRLRLIG